MSETDAKVPGKCRYCGKAIKRIDNLRRHEKETCELARILCVCGKKWRKSSLFRHLKTFGCENTANPEEISIVESSAQQVQNSNSGGVNTKTYKLNIEVRITENDDGTIGFNYDAIEIGGNQMVLVPASSLSLVNTVSAGK